MARLVFGGDDVTYRGGLGAAVLSQADQEIRLYLDAAATQPALDLQTYPGAVANVTGAVRVDSWSRVPLFYGPDGVDTLYAVVSGGPATAIYARTDDRIDSLSVEKVTGQIRNAAGQTVLTRRLVIELDAFGNINDIKTEVI